MVDVHKEIEFCRAKNDSFELDSFVSRSLFHGMTFAFYIPWM